MYELNTWLWQFGRGKPHVGGLSVADKEDRRIAVLQDGARVAMPHGPKESTKRRPGAPVAAENDLDWALKDIPGIS
jgi:hypothetical protein